MTAFLCDLLTTDTNLHARLYAPGETPPDIETNQDDQLVLTRLTEQIDYGPYVVFVATLVTNRFNSGFDMPFATARYGLKWYMTRSLDQEPGLGFFENLFFEDLVSPHKHLHVISPDSGRVEPGMVRTNLYPQGSQTPPAITLQYRGQVYSPPQPIPFDIVRGSNEDLSSLEGVVNAVYAACRNADADWLISLVGTTEVASAQSAVWDSRQALRNYIVKGVKIVIAENTKKITSAHITQVVDYGNYAIVLLNNTRMDGTIHKDWLVLRQEGQQWFLSNQLGSVSDPVFSFLIGKGATWTSFLFKISPDA